MLKRKLEKLNIETSVLGFGCMRFPLNSEGKIKEVEAEKMLDLAIASGVNYIDTAYPYHGGESELFVGKVLKKYPRNSFYLATKLPMFYVEKEEDVNRFFSEQLEKLQMDYVDFYLLHALNKTSFQKVKDFKVLEKLIEFKNQGKIKYIGFSFHDEYELFEEIINYYDWDFCQIQFNYMDTDTQAGLKGYELTCKKNIPLVIMEPIKGGLLAKLPGDISNILEKQGYSKTDSAFALRYVASFENVKVILSGMSNLEQVQDNLNTFNNYKELSVNEQENISLVVKKLKERIKNGCTGCRYCMPCPKGVNIPGLFYNWNQYGVYDNETSFVNRMDDFKKKEMFVDKCVNCKACEKICPQHLQITSDFKKILDDYNNIKNK